MATPISPEAVAEHLEDIGADCHDLHEAAPHELQKLCADSGDKAGLAFWVSVYTRYLVYEAHFGQTGCFPDIERDDVIDYLAMMFWDEGWNGPHEALWCAEVHQHPVSARFFQRLNARSSELAALWAKQYSCAS